MRLNSEFLWIGVRLQWLLSPSPGCPWSLTAPRCSCRVLTWPFTNWAPDQAVPIHWFTNDSQWYSPLTISISAAFPSVEAHALDENVPLNAELPDKMDVWWWTVVTAWTRSSLMWWACQQASGAAVVLKRQLVHKPLKPASYGLYEYH